MFFVERESNTLYCGDEASKLFKGNKLVDGCIEQKEKPVYTKEMHKRGELPVVGMELLITFKYGNTFKGKIKYICSYGFVFEREDGKDGFYGSLDIVEFKPLPTIEDELAEFVFQNSGIMSRDGGMESAIDISRALLDKYNITPKGGIYE